MKKYLISGIPISDSGVGRLMRKIAPDAETWGYTVITLPPLGSIKTMLKARQYHRVLFEIINRIFGKLFFKFRLALIRKSVILLIHPQISGFKNCIRLIRNNQIYFYVMDNSFFCLRSYNIDPYKSLECLKCLGDPENSFQDCQPYPISYSRKENIEFIKVLMNLSSQVVFLAQNENQKKLLGEHFGSETNCIVVGLNTGEIPLGDRLDDRAEVTSLDENLKFDIVYHGAAHLAKGLHYIVELARILEEFSFFVPEDKSICELIIGKPIECHNITFKSCRWESGLKIAVSQANLVINPSLWSASIEGALLKSVFFGSKVATVQTQYGFEGELSKYINLIRLPLEVNLAANIIRNTLMTDYSMDERLTRRFMLIEFLRRKSVFSVIDNHLLENFL